MKPKLYIEVRGGPGAGKSTVAHYLAGVFEQHGIKVDIEDIDGPSPHPFAKRFDALANKGLEVEIKTVPVHRAFVTRPGCSAAPKFGR